MKISLISRMMQSTISSISSIWILNLKVCRLALLLNPQEAVAKTKHHNEVTRIKFGTAKWYWFTRRTAHFPPTDQSASTKMLALENSDYVEYFNEHKMFLLSIFVSLIKNIEDCRSERFDRRTDASGFWFNFWNFWYETQQLWAIKPTWPYSHLTCSTLRGKKKVFQSSWLVQQAFCFPPSVSLFSVHWC